MIARTIFGLCAAALVAGAASAAETSKSGKNDPDKIVCRTERDTGTRLGRSRVCKTNAQWVEQRRQTQQTIDRIQNSRAGSAQ